MHTDSLTYELSPGNCAKIPSRTELLEALKSRVCIGGGGSEGDVKPAFFLAIRPGVLQRVLCLLLKKH